MSKYISSPNEVNENSCKYSFNKCKCLKETYKEFLKNPENFNQHDSLKIKYEKFHECGIFEDFEKVVKKEDCLPIIDIMIAIINYYQISDKLQLKRKTPGNVFENVALAKEYIYKEKTLQSLLEKSGYNQDKYLENVRKGKFCDIRKFVKCDCLEKYCSDPNRLNKLFYSITKLRECLDHSKDCNKCY